MEGTYNQAHIMNVNAINAKHTYGVGRGNLEPSEGETVRLNIEMDQALHRRVKVASAKRGITLRTLITTMLTDMLETTGE